VEVNHGARQPVQPRDNQRVTFADEFESQGELFTIRGIPTTSLLREDFFAPCRRQRFLLDLQRLAY